MSDIASDQENCYRNLIMNGRIPVVFPNSLTNWEMLKWSLQDWEKAFGDKVYPFRCGMNYCSKTPQWEGTCTTESHSMNEFFNFSRCNNNKKWMYFDYKHIKQWFNENEMRSFHDISWSKFGFPEIRASESTIWIGSIGANTTCHVDSYGCNLVAQLYGRKRWILFPPSETNNLEPTRIPYEESSVYSNINFHCVENLKNKRIQDCYHIELKAGDVLYVPPKWWHFVENLSTAISINTWIPHVKDDEWRLEEALVQYFLSLATAQYPGMMESILNPNEMDLVNKNDYEQLLESCIHRCRESTLIDKYQTNLKSYNNIDHQHLHGVVPKISFNDLQNILMGTCTCSRSNKKNSTGVAINSIEEENKFINNIINAFCNPNVISLIKDKLLDNR